MVRFELCEDSVTRWDPCLCFGMDARRVELGRDLCVLFGGATHGLLSPLATRSGALERPRHKTWEVLLTPRNFQTLEVPRARYSGVFSPRRAGTSGSVRAPGRGFAWPARCLRLWSG